MSYFAAVVDRVTALNALVGDVESAEQLPAAVTGLADASSLEFMRIAGQLADAANQLCAISAAVISRRSHRDAGVDGIAQSKGHRNVTSLVQELTGSTRADAAKQVRVGESILDATLPHDVPPADEQDAVARQHKPTETPAVPWHACLTRAQLAGVITVAQLDVIRRGLGEPPVQPGASEAWSAAAEHLAVEASERTVEELLRTARTVRDQLDPEGARARFAARYEARAFRTYTDADGVHHAHLVCEDEGFAWIRAIVDAALRPRRGGPRFVDAEERQRAADMVADPRTNDQLAYDLIMDVLRAGALADAKQVFGTRQAGIRIVHVAGHDAMPVLEDDGSSLPEWLIRTQTCNAGTVHVTLDGCGNPLDVGREHRLFTPKQRLALAIRDGGCRWRGCDRPASYCEAHHIDEWHADEGRTDIDRGILLCRYHHMTLHNGGWRITREGKGDFLLHPPGSAPPVTLVPRLARKYLWGIDPPPRRFHPAA